ncbi:MAG TPA: CHASE sensor domain-containing protein, partial [Candidatus Kapabacteria bacterium]|nr:CHASE sensor domain-containing protein [Candidatus Kapabacteria bacterium]
MSEAKIISYNISSALFFNDLDAIGESIEAAKLNENIIYVVVTDNNNKIITAYNSQAAKLFEYLKISYEDDYSHKLTVYKICSNITYKGEKIGHLYLAHSLIELNERVYNIQITIGTISVIILILAILFVVGIS